MSTIIVAVKPKNHPFPLFSWLIRLIQKTDYSHYAIIPEHDQNSVVDSRIDGVKVRDRKEFFEHYTVLKSWHVKSMHKSKWDAWLGVHLGKKYSMWQNIGFALRFLGIVKSNPFGKGDRELVCSELIAVYLAAVYTLFIFSDDFDLNRTELLLNDVVHNK